VAAVAWFGPFLTRDRETISSVPTPQPLVRQGVEVKPREQACIDEVTFDTDSEIVELAALKSRQPGPPLALAAEAVGYRAETSVDGGYDQPAVMRAGLEPPQHSTMGTLCIRNAGDRPVDLLASNDPRTNSLRSTTRLGESPIVEDVSVRLLAADSGTVVERAGELVGRAAAFKPPVLGTPLLWLVLLLVVVGVPAGGLYALASSFRESS
jgi:hypothetical protein